LKLPAVALAATALLVSGCGSDLVASSTCDDFAHASASQRSAFVASRMRSIADAGDAQAIVSTTPLARACQGAGSARLGDVFRDVSR
jgi:hypothetical protein